MGWLQRLLGTEDAKAAPPPATVSVPAPRAAGAAATGPNLAPGGYAVVDVETTGLSPRQDRIVSVAVVLLDGHGRVQHEWASMVNPQGPVGATHIHGIRDVDVAGAPVFAAVLPHLAGLLTGRAMVGHNVAFDVAFLKYEFGRASWGWPPVPTFCTLEESFHFLPALDRRRLVDCCWASGIRLDGAHSALGDARATATLLASYLDPGFGFPPLPAHRAVLGAAATVAWPTGPGTGWVADPSAPRRKVPARVRRQMAAAPPQLETLLETFTLTDALDDGAPAGALSYLETLVEVLEDGQVTEDEQAALADIIELYDLTDTDVAAAHRGFIRALAREALEDGVLARAERAELRHAAALLDVAEGDVKDLLDGEEEARLAALSARLAPLPEGWSLGEPLRVGQRVVFTGCDDRERTVLEDRARAAGVRVTGSVSRRTAMLVTDGSFAGTKAAAAAELQTRIVHPRDFATLLDHLQPHTDTAALRNLPSGARAADVAALVPEQTGPRSVGRDPSPSEVRTWALRHGFDVGVRGRLAAEVWDAYAAAHG